MSTQDFIVELVLFVFFGFLSFIMALFAKSYRIRRKQGKWFESAKGYLADSRAYTVGPVITDSIIWKSVEKLDKYYKHSDLTIKIVEATTKRTNELDNYIEENWKKACEEQTNLTNGKGCGLNSIVFGEDGKVELSFYKSEYKYFIGTNVSYTKPEFFKFIDKNVRSVMEDDEGYKYLENSLFANDLASALLIITKDNKIILSKRSNFLYVVNKSIHASVAEGMNFNLDKCNPVSTLIRGCEEELNYSIEKYIDSIEILTFGLYLPYAQPFFLARLQVEETYDEIRKGFDDRDLELLDNNEGDIFSIDNDLKKAIPYLLEFDIYKKKIELADLCRILLLQHFVDVKGSKKVSKALNKGFILKNE